MRTRLIGTAIALSTAVRLVGIVGLLGFVSQAAAQSAPDIGAITGAWANSAHADAQAEAFSHWNEDGEIPENCAVCHSGEGFRAFYGLDGSEAGTIGHPVAIGGVVDCDTCHAEGCARYRLGRVPLRDRGRRCRAKRHLPDLPSGPGLFGFDRAGGGSGRGGCGQCGALLHQPALCGRGGDGLWIAGARRLRI